MSIDISTIGLWLEVCFFLLNFVNIIIVFFKKKFLITYGCFYTAPLFCCMLKIQIFLVWGALFVCVFKSFCNFKSHFCLFFINHAIDVYMKTTSDNDSYCNINLVLECLFSWKELLALSSCRLQQRKFVTFVFLKMLGR